MVDKYGAYPQLFNDVWYILLHLPIHYSGTDMCIKTVNNFEHFDKTLISSVSFDIA
jgi:hypothetical protein